MIGLFGYGPLLLEGFGLTLLVAISSMAVAVMLGLLGAWATLAGGPVARWAAATYTTVVRGVPELVMILLVYYGLPTIIQHLGEAVGHPVRVDFHPFSAGTLTIGFIYGAFATEVFRGAYFAVPKGQLEAAFACGMNRLLTIRRVLLPQMWRYAIPGLGNVWMVLIKATALISVIELRELMRSAEVAAQATRQPFTFYVSAALLYLVLTVVSSLVQHRAEAWVCRGTRRA